MRVARKFIWLNAARLAIISLVLVAVQIVLPGGGAKAATTPTEGFKFGNDTASEYFDNNRVKPSDGGMLVMNNGLMPGLDVNGQKRKFTVESWVFNDNYDHNAAVVLLGGYETFTDASVNNAISIYSTSRSSWVVDSAGWSSTVFNTPTLTDGEWHHVAVSGDENGIRIWIDGVAHTSASGCTNINYCEILGNGNARIANGGVLNASKVIGGWGGAGGKYSNGAVLSSYRLSDVARYSTTAATISVSREPLTAVDSNTKLLLNNPVTGTTPTDTSNSPQTLTINSVSNKVAYTDQIVVSYNYNGATGSNSVTSALYTGTEINLPTPTKSNFTFRGWYESNTFTGQRVFSRYTTNADITLHAKWTSNSDATDLPGSIYFDGSSAIQVTDLSSPGTGAFTYEMWIKPNLSSTFILLETRGNAYDGNGMDWGITSSGQIYGNFTSKPFYLSANSAITANVWQHIAITRIAAGQAIKVFVNGTEATDTDGRTDDIGKNFSSASMWLGGNVFDVVPDQIAFSKGYISNFRFTKGTGVYAANFTDPRTAPTQLDITANSLLIPFNKDTDYLSGSIITQGNANFVARSGSPIVVTNSSVNAGTYKIWHTAVGSAPASSGDSPFPKLVAFNSNGGFGSMANQSAASTANLSAASFTRAGYSFNGWNTKADGTGTSYADSASFAFTSSERLFAQWIQTVDTVTFNKQNNSASSTAGVLRGASATPPTAPTWYGYNFKGWSETTNGVIRDLSTVTISAAKTFYAIWEQKSLAGLSNLPTPNTLSPDASNDQIVISQRGSTSTSVKVPAGALPSTYSVKVYTLSNNDLAAQTIGANNTYIISQVVAWSDTANGSVGNIQDTAAGKPIEMTITSPDIKTGAKVYSILDNASTLLATATQDGSVRVTFSVDPVIVVQAAPVVPPAGGGGYVAAPTPTPTASKPPVITSARSFNVIGFNPGSWQLTKSIKKSIESFFKSINKPSKISCVGYTMGPTVLRADYNLAMRRGQEVCNYVVAKNPTVAKMTTKGTTTKISDGKYRRTTINWTDE